MLSIIWLVLSSAIIFSSGLKLNDTCVTYDDGEEGKCIFVRGCPHIMSRIVQKNLTPEDIEFIEGSRCGTLKRKALVCCKKQEIEFKNLLPQQPDCGLEFGQKIYGGKDADIDQFGWLSLLGYENGNETSFHCGGSLINSRYVITAAHCINPDPNYKLKFVRLGEWNLKTETDCDKHGFCTPPVQDILIEKIIEHENFELTETYIGNDIALLRLNREVEFDDIIKPICIPNPKTSTEHDYEGEGLFVAGWGKTATRRQAKIKQVAEVPFVNVTKCNDLLKSTLMEKIHMCAGGVKGVDSCRGDSGGPLMQKDESYINLVGLVSYGAYKCGTENEPGVYARVDGFYDWIISKLEP